MKQLMEPLDLHGLSLRSRLVRSATWEGMAPESGEVTPKLVDVYAELAAGGVGVIITGFTSVAANDRYFGGMVRLCDNGLISGHTELVQAVHAHGVPVIAQLALGGYWRADGTMAEPDEMDGGDIAQVVGWFADAARRAREAGYDGVQIHLAHFFFLSRFVSPAHNHRTDAYGGSNENRARIALEILAAIRSAAPSLHVSAKVNCSDFTVGGLEPKDSLEIGRLLDAAGIDSIEVSGNGTSVGGIRAGQDEGYFLDFAAHLAEAVHTPVICVGGWRSVESMQAALDATQVAALSLSRPLVREPDLPARWSGGDTSPSACVSCNACYNTPGHMCIFRLREARAREVLYG